MNNIQFHISQDTKSYQIIGPLMELKSKLLAYQNMVPDLIFMLVRGNRSHIYVKTWKPIQVSVLKCNTD